MTKRKIREPLRKVIEENTNRYGKCFDYFIQFLILSSLVDFSIETLPNNSEKTIKILDFFELFCLTVFSIEYLLRIYVAKKPLKYIFSFYGLIDLFSIIPFYLKTSIDLRPLRAFRIFRVFRALKLIRYNKALNRFQIAARLIKEEAILFSMLTGILLFLSSAGIYVFEKEAQPKLFKSIFHSFWWSIETLTTLGYGDIYPVTIGGKVFTFFVLMVGVGVVTIPAGLVASAISRARKIQKEELEKKHNDKQD